MIVVEPAPVSVTSPVEALTVATEALELEYVIAPLLLDVGAVNVNGAEPYVFVSTDMTLSPGSLKTVSVVEVVAPAYVAVACCVAVIVVVPPLTIVTTPVDALTVATVVLELVYVIAPALLDVGAVNVNAELL